MTRSALLIIFISVLNLLVLSIFLWLWTDPLLLTFDPGVRPRELLQLMGITFVFLTGWQLLAFFRRKNKPQKSNWKAAVLILLLLSSFWYITYSQKIIANFLLLGSLGKHLAAKIPPETFNTDMSTMDFYPITRFH